MDGHVIIISLLLIGWVLTALVLFWCVAEKKDIKNLPKFSPPVTTDRSKVIKWVDEIAPEEQAQLEVLKKIKENENT